MRTIEHECATKPMVMNQKQSSTSQDATHALLVDLLRPIIYQAVQEALENLNQQPVERAPRPLNIDEAADFCQCSKHSLYQHTAASTIPHFKRGNRLLFCENDLLKWLKEGQK